MKSFSFRSVEFLIIITYWEFLHPLSHQASNIWSLGLLLVTWYLSFLASKSLYISLLTCSSLNLLLIHFLPNSPPIKSSHFYVHCFIYILQLTSALLIASTIILSQWSSNCDGHITLLHFQFIYLWISWLHLKLDIPNTTPIITSAQIYYVSCLFWRPLPFSQSSRYEALDSPSTFSFLLLSLSQWLKLVDITVKK